jgi:hypothetical protein
MAGFEAGKAKHVSLGVNTLHHAVVLCFAAVTEVIL